MKHMRLKDFALIAAGLLVAAALFFTVGSYTNHPTCKFSTYVGAIISNPSGCEEKDKSTGFPLVYKSQKAFYDGPTYYDLGSLLIDATLWFIVGGVITFGAFMLLPDKSPKKKK